jgi:hypothetical protein
MSLGRLAFAGIAASFVVVACGGTERDRSFDSATWKSDRHRPAMITDLRQRYVHRGAKKSALYPAFGWPEEFSGYDYDYSRHWGYCLQQKLFSGSDSDYYCAQGLEIYFAPPNYTTISAVRISRSDGR